MSAFENLGVMPELIRAIDEMGWLLPRPVQAEAVPLILGGGDVMVAAETGSGKTGAFALPILQIVEEAFREKSHASDSSQPNKVQLNPNDRDPVVAMDESGTLCQSRAEKSWAGIRANCGVGRSGRWYYEVTVTDEGLSRVGWSTVAATYNIGTDKQSFGYGGTAKKSFSRRFDDYGEMFSKGDVIGCMLDWEDKSISYSKNGKHLGQAFDIPKHLDKAKLYPTCVLKNAEVQFNFGEEKLKYKPPEYKPMKDALHHQASSESDDASPSQQKGKPIAIVVEPTRELAEQVYQEIGKFKKYLNDPPINQVLCVGGGKDTKSMMKNLKQGCEIVVGTPGKLKGLIDQGNIKLENIRFFVLDEADRMTESGMYETVMSIFTSIKNLHPQLQVLMMSATLHTDEVQGLADKITNYPTWVDLKGKDAVPDTVHHAVWYVDPTKYSWSFKNEKVLTDGVHKKDKTGPVHSNPESYSEAVKRMKPEIVKDIIDANKMDQCLIFCRTKLDCDNLEKYLVAVGGGQKFTGKKESGKENPYSCVVLHGDRHRNERQENLHAFKEGDVRFLICTDVAARGIDIKELPYVINVTMPQQREDYIHRIGRVGRAEAMGLAISLVAKKPEKMWYHTCPSRGKNCNNTRLVQDGGCCIWFDETDMLKQVEQRIDQSIPELDKNLRFSQGGDVIYGETMGGAAAKTAAAVEKLKPTTKELAMMEMNLQNSWLHFRNKYPSVK
eukprot:gb/GECH01014126.1/.p1 GENE.gb/GECH01014126.1/~~gb/GECH01014126.1/.p1  ORF type:complete len:725 (+),score=180.09 gb/GECH01014126.1/:1-2175(+)